MWNSYQTDEYSGMLARTEKIASCNGDTVTVYHAEPLTKGEHPGLILIPHMPGWDEYCREAARRFAEHGYNAICPNIYERVGHGTPSEVAMKAREMGGVTDESVMNDTKGALNYLRNAPSANGKIGVIGMCSGGRHTFLAACTIDKFDAAVDCWGGGVVCPKEQLTPARPVAPIDYTKDLKCPLIGIFGNDDRMPTPEEVDILEDELKKYGKEYEFYRYDGAGHGMWYYDKPMYRQEQAMDSFNKVIGFLDKHLKDE